MSSAKVARVFVFTLGGQSSYDEWLGPPEGRVTRRLLFLLLLISVTGYASAFQRVTVQQFEQVLSASHGKKDAEVARRILALELTERVSSERLSKWQAQSPGPKTHQALIAVTDTASFLDLPPSEIPSKSAPDLQAQRQIISMSVAYVKTTLGRLPNLFASRETTRFEDIPIGTREELAVTSVYQPLHVVSRASNTVLVRDGKEVAARRDYKGSDTSPFVSSLTTVGEFGPILATVMVDASKGTTLWSHWEQGANGLLAVFSFSIPQPKSDYEVQWCCVQEKKGLSTYSSIFHEFAGYHGEMAVDPATGTVVRLVIVADMKPSDPISEAEIEVEYGPVQLGGQTYICPVKSIAIARQPVPMSNGLVSADDHLSDPQKTSLNDVIFDRYHLFRSESHIILNGDAAQ